MTASMTCKVAAHGQAGPGIFILELKAAALVSAAGPGQFVHLKTADGIDPLWRRPFSIHRVNRRRGTILLSYRRIGRGTSLLARRTAGDTIDLLGPLGRPFDLEGGFTTAVIAAGGLGAAPVPFLLDALRRKGRKAVVLWGVRSKTELYCLDALRGRYTSIHIATEDGTEGFRGRVTDLFGRLASEFASGSGFRGFACGPMPMLKALQPLAAASGFPWQASLEERMACGVGVCQGCVVRMKNRQYRTVCADGPVFDLAELDFHD
ncbi:MAG: dihydroorotate dehydrogenase electron transfer subunit [bacterium]|nr:dihydroorotate dehydrogenase electron transfer subunit [bacterium]